MSATATAPLLCVNDLRAYFRTRDGLARAVDGVSFAIREGETYALVGESGCGKSVTALSVMRLLPRPAGFIAGGSIRLADRELTRLPPIAMRALRGNQVSMIFQEPMTALNPVFTIGNQLEETLRLHRRLGRKAARREAAESLRKVGMPDPLQRLDEYPHQLSGGMRQRVMIAMALACRPRLLIADEPTTALDVTIQSQILDLIRALQEDTRTSVLLITHDMGVVAENAARVGVMYAGRLVEEADRARLFAAPAHPYTRMLLKALPHLDHTHGRRLATIPGMVPSATRFPEGCRFHNRCPHAMPVCRERSPGYYPIADGQHVACWLYAPEANQAPINTTDAPPPGADEMISAKTPDVEPRPLLSVSELRVHFPIRHGVFRRATGYVRAVDGVELTLARGETLALVGESGCGKTTVGKAIVRLQPATGGHILIDGQDIAALSRAASMPLRRRAQMIFQDPGSSLDPRLRVGDTIEEGLRAHGFPARERRTRTAAMLERVGLEPAAVERYPHEFSGGQRQRIGIARALVMQPDLVVCDEATSSLDVSVQAQILNLLMELREAMGLSYLFISHDIGVVRHIADRIAVMYVGRIVESGPALDVIDAPRHPYTRALVAAVPRLDGAQRKRIILPGDVPSPAAPPAGCRFHPRCPFAIPACQETDPPLKPSRHDPQRLTACLRDGEI